MKSYRQMRGNSWLLLFALAAVAFMSAGCTSDSIKSSPYVNPLGAYQNTEGGGGLATDGTVQNPGAINSPIISVPTDGSGSINGHDNAPLLDNMHPGWQQSTCLSCHNNTSRNPDHNYTDSNMCYLCHGTNGMPGFADNVPPILSGVVTNPTDKSVTISWTTDKLCLSRLVLRTTTGDRLEFPVSTSYVTKHRYTVNGLIPETNYFYELISTDKNGNRTSSSSFGTLGFSTQVEQVDLDSIGTSNPTEVNSFFSNVDISEDGPFKANVKFTVADPSTVFIYFVYQDSNQLDSQMKLNDMVGGGPITTFDGFVNGLDADTDYIVFLEATDSQNKTHESENYFITTDSF